MTGSPRAACYRHLQGVNDFRPATPAEVDRLRPCRFCFPAGQVDVDAGNLVVAGSRGEAVSIHRDEATGSLDWSPGHDGGTDLVSRLEKMGADDVPRIGGGGA